MIIGNSISGPAVAVDRLLADVSDKKHESETRLAFGATRSEAILPAMRAAVLAALIPNLNMMSVVGIVSIPGIKTLCKTVLYSFAYQIREGCCHIS
jgi:putative ABC transport system permease protein